MIIENEAKDLAENVIDVAHTVQILCPNCNRDVTEEELAAKACSDCGHSLEEPKQNVAIEITSIPGFGSTLI